MKSSSLIKKTTAVVTSLAMLLCMASCGKKEETTQATQTTSNQPVYTAKAGSVQKKETVYVNIGNDGKVNKVNVTDWIHTDKGEVCVDDVSTLTDIENIKEDNAPVVKGGTLQWNMTETDLYYSGTTKNTPPVSLDIKYYLDGKEIKPDDIIGKSGKVKIEVTMKNNLTKEIEIDGETKTISLPMMVVGGFILPESNFTGIQVKGGRSIGDGTKEIAVMFGFPGMSESLGLDELGVTDIEGLDLGSTVSVTADAKDFELGNMYFAAVPIGSLNLDFGDENSLENIESTIAILKQVQNTISGMDIPALINMFTAEAGSSQSLVNVLGDIANLYVSNRALIQVLIKYIDPSNNEAVKKVLEFLSDENTERALEILSSPIVVKFFTDLSKLGDAFPLTAEFFTALQDPAVKLAIQNLPQTLSKLAEIQNALVTNTDAIGYLISLLDGDTVNSITQILNLIGATDMSDFEEKYSVIVENAGTISERCAQWIAFGQEYRLFTDAAEDMETSVLFVYMTPSLEKEVVVADNSESESEESILDTFVKKFR